MRNATCQSTMVDMSMRMIHIDRRVLRVIPRPVSDFVLTRMCSDLRIGPIKMRSIHQLRMTKPIALSRTNGACSMKTSPPFPRTTSLVVAGEPSLLIHKLRTSSLKPSLGPAQGTSPPAHASPATQLVLEGGLCSWWSDLSQAGRGIQPQACVKTHRATSGLIQLHTQRSWKQHRAQTTCQRT